MKVVDPQEARPDTSPIVLDRTLRGPIDKVWRLWTTTTGLEKWWGPEGFKCVVNHVDLRVGGGFEIAMTAIRPEIVDMLTRTGVPVTSYDRAVYSDVLEHRRLAWSNVADFIPGVAPYATTTHVEMSSVGGETRVVVTLDRMHDAHWTRMKTMGWDQQLDTLMALVARGGDAGAA